MGWPASHLARGPIMNHNHDQDHRLLTVGLPHVLQLLVLAPIRGHKDHLHAAPAPPLPGAGVGPGAKG